MLTLKKRIIVVITILVFLILFDNVGFAASGDNQNVSKIKIAINDNQVGFSDDLGYPFIDENNRTQVPFRATLEAFGATVSWDGQNKVAIAEKNNIVVKIPIGKMYIFKNDEQISNDTAAIIKDSRVYLPIRVVMEAFGCKVGWDNATGTVQISGPEGVVAEAVPDKTQFVIDGSKFTYLTSVYSYTHPKGSTVPFIVYRSAMGYTFVFISFSCGLDYDTSSFNSDSITLKNKDGGEYSIFTVSSEKSTATSATGDSETINKIELSYIIEDNNKEELYITDPQGNTYCIRPVLYTK